jgi:peptidoglycan hydrolase CwlO-like protein/surface antigen
MPKKSNLTSVFARRCKASVLLAVGVLFVVGVVFPGARHHFVQAATCSSSSDCLNQINSLNSSNGSSQAKLSDLAGQAASYQQVIDQLQSRISKLQGQITANLAEQAQLKQQIVETQKKIEAEKATLGDVLRSMYVDGQMSTIEMLATSNTLSDYVDKQEYRNSVQSKVQDAMAEIAKLQQQLQDKETKVANLITTEQSQKNQVESDKAQQSKLLAYNVSQQSAYNAKIAANKKSISSLYVRLSALTSAGTVNYSGTCGGGYPSSATNRFGSHWGCHYRQDNTVDNWNMYNRECVSYTAWMVYKNYGYSTYGWGNAYEWIGEAESRGISVSQTPRAGDVAIRDRDYSEPGDVGHAMYVVSARSSSDITVWEYNRHYDGTFDQRTFNPHDYSAPVYYLHFR